MYIRIYFPVSKVFLYGVSTVDHIQYVFSLLQLTSSLKASIFFEFPLLFPLIIYSFQKNLFWSLQLYRKFDDSSA